ncbi:hypothetical protein ACGF0K_32380 [Streptomyces sp. NPDC048156]|uniref:hypothetical protein n=1 Tax=Streptomyces sp. NPDC048156 TaxID=3365502 RepID=UPI00371F2D06
MRIIIEDVPEDLARDIAALIGGHQSEPPVSFTPEWTVTRAEQLLRDLPKVAAQLIREAAAGNGWAPAEKLRGPDGKESLRGRSGAITKAINRGAASQRWPANMPAPVQAQYDPEVPAYQRTTGYVMTEDLVPVFRAAVERVDRAADK